MVSLTLLDMNQTIVDSLYPSSYSSVYPCYISLIKKVDFPLDEWKNLKTRFLINFYFLIKGHICELHLRWKDKSMLEGNF